VQVFKTVPAMPLEEVIRSSALPPFFRVVMKQEEVKDNDTIFAY
jgi:hypothetical protein